MLQVEDMLKRSFAEARAQQAAPETVKAIEQGQGQLAALQAQPWPDSLQGTTRSQVTLCGRPKSLEGQRGAWSGLWWSRV